MTDTRGWVSAVLAGALMGGMLAYPKVAGEAALEGLILCVTRVIPGLFPFLVCAKLLRARGRALIVVSWLCGSPGGAKLLTEGESAPRGALKAAALTGTMSPMFLLYTLPEWLDAPVGWALATAHFAGACLSALLWKGKIVCSQSCDEISLSRSLAEAGGAMLSVAGCMALGSAACAVILNLLPALSPPAEAAIMTLAEISTGARAICALPLSLRLRGALISAACGFGGASLFMQNFAYWQKKGVSAARLILSRCAHALFSFVIAYLIIPCG